MKLYKSHSDRFDRHRDGLSCYRLLSLMTALNNQVLCGRIVNVSFKLVVRVKLLQGKFVISYASNFDLVILGSPAQD